MHQQILKEDHCTVQDQIKVGQMMKPRLLESVEEMVSPGGLASLIGSAVESVERGAFQSEGFSGANHERVSVLDSSGQTTHFVLKHLSI